MVDVQMPFADDVRHYTFPSLTTVKNSKGVPLTKHPNLPTKEMEKAMDNMVDAMSLIVENKEDESGYQRLLSLSVVEVTFFFTYSPTFFFLTSDP